MSDPKVIHLGPGDENEEDRRFRRPDKDLDAFLEDWEDVPEADLPRRPVTPPIRPRRVETDQQERWSNEVRGTPPDPNRARQRQQRRRQPQVPFPSRLFGLPYEEYAEKPEWYDNLSWGILGSYMIAILALLIAIL